jgi:tRNA G10  N-methylase Trm11
MGDTRVTYATLFGLAARRLKSGGRLVFWYPTEALVDEEEVRAQLGKLLVHAVGEGGRGLVLERMSREELNGALWRWLCVYTKR